MNATHTPVAIQRFLDGIQTADWDGMEAYYTPEALYDATVPGWRYQYKGPERILQELKQEWTGKNTWHFAELHITPTADGVVVDCEARGHRSDAHGQPPYEVVSRLANIFRLEGGRIAEHRLYCAGEWDESIVRRVEMHAPKVDRTLVR